MIKNRIFLNAAMIQNSILHCYLISFFAIRIECAFRIHYLQPDMELDKLYYS